VAELSRRPYLLRAMHDWICDSGHTPHVVVDATKAGVQVPPGFVNDGRIVLNVSLSATQGLLIGADFLEFTARFGGVSHYVRVPIQAVQGVYARETSEGMVFPEEGGPVDADPSDPADPPPAAPSTGSGPAAPTRARPSLKVVK
jgi:stringent starvation protein B